MDAITGETSEFIGEQAGRQAWGLNHDEDHGVLLVAGGSPDFGGGNAEVYVYDASTKASLAACAQMPHEGGSMVNGIGVLDGVAYVTDSFYGKLMAFDLAMAKAGTCEVWEVDLPESFAPIEGAFMANGIKPYKDGLLVSNTQLGSVWYLTGLEKGTAGSTVTPSFQQVIADGDAANSDGIILGGDKLYSTANFSNEVVVFQLAMDEATSTLSATSLGVVTNPDFDTPSTSVLYDGYIYTANLRLANHGDLTAPLESTVVGTEDPYDEDDHEDDHDHATDVSEPAAPVDDGASEPAAPVDDASTEENGAKYGASGALPVLVSAALYMALA